MAKKTTTERDIEELANELLEVRQELNVLKTAEKGLADALRKRMKDGEEQDVFYFLPVTSLKITNIEKALKWAKKNAPAIITVNTTLARKVFLADALTGSRGTPESAGFELHTTEQLREARGSGVEPGYDIG